MIGRFFSDSHRRLRRADRLQATVMTRPYVLIKIKKEPGVEKIALVDEEGNALQSRSISSR